MSSIQKMSIMGIRSFGPDERDRQVIEFFSPLTLILGPNGTGKTSIIECLKFMTTGELPPGSKTNGAFIHDPKIAHEREVKAQVKLQFKDVRQQQVVAVRNLIATQKPKKVEMKRLEGVIRRVNEHGETTTVSSRCAEMDSEMVSLLGVSKPVLENVIFCHQEDSNWPLSEGKTLKEKFDDIFASSRYVKALEVIRKTKQEQEASLKEMKTELSYLKQNKEKADQLQSELTDTLAHYDASKEKVDSIEAKIQPIEEQQEIINKRGNEFHKIESKIKAFEAQKGEIEKSVEEIRSKLENEFQGETEELENMLREFQEKVKERQQTQQKLEDKMEELEKNVLQFGREKSRLLHKQGKLQQEKEGHQQTLTKQDRLIKRIADELEISGFSGELTADSAERFLNALRVKEQNVEEEYQENKQDFEDQDSAVQTEIDTKRTRKTKLETEKKMKANSIATNEKELKLISEKLREAEEAAGKLKDLERDLKRAELELKNTEGSVDLSTLKEEINALQSEKQQLEASLRLLDNDLNRISKEASTRSVLDEKIQSRSKLEEQVRRLRSKNEGALIHLLGSVPEDNYRKAVDMYLNTHSRLVRTHNKELEDLRQKLSGLKISRKHLQDHLAKREEERKSYCAKIMSVCESQDLDDGLQQAEKDMEEIQNKLGFCIGSEKVFQRYKEQIERQEEKACPLCNKPLVDDIEVEELISDLNTKLAMIPLKREEHTRKHERAKAKYEEALQLRPIKEQLDEIEKEIPDEREKIKKLTGQIEQLQKDIETREEELESQQADENQANMMKTDMTVIDQKNAELRDLNRKIDDLSSKLSGEDNGKTMQQINEEREDNQLQQETVNKNLERKRQKQMNYTEQVQELKSKMNEVLGKKLNLEQKMQEKSRLADTRQELEEQNVSLLAEISECDVQLHPIELEIDQLVKEKDALSKRKDAKLDKFRDMLNSMKSSREAITDLSKEIGRYIESGKENELENIEEEIKRIADQLEHLDSQKEDVSFKINKIRKDLATQQVRQRELQDNILLREKMSTVIQKEEELRKEKKKLGGIDVSNLVIEERKLRDEKQQLTREKDMALGRLQGFESEIRRFKKELKDDMFKDAENKYTSKMIDFKTTEIAIDDLNKYYIALDKAIMTYHSTKMAEINKIIREMWRKTYKGNDIETIEIRSEDDDTKTIGKRRTYNYRVVMIKGETAIDMRGRCSAGQKVLASLIIRLALAETFCLSCGILALDEPTTNLDRENIESMAYALVEIIKARSQQRNFQLIIITHDEDFVELLGRSDYVDLFFKVSKNDLGCSQLKRAKVQDLHTR